MINRYNHISAQLLMKCVLDHLKYTDEDIMIPKTTHAGRGQGHLDESKKPELYRQTYDANPGKSITI